MPDTDNGKIPDDGEKPTLTFPQIGPPPEDPDEYLGGIGRRQIPVMHDVLAETVPGMQDRETMILAFVRAQGAFIRAQSFFLEVGRNVADDKAYIEHLTGFATAQATLIKAQQDFLRMFGAM